MSNEKTIRANKADSKPIQALISKYPQAKIETNIPEHNKGVYNILGLSLKRGEGISVELETRVFTVSEKDWLKSKKEGLEDASNYGFEEMHILHDPTLKEETKDVDSDKEELKELKAKAKELGLDFAKNANLETMKGILAAMEQ